VPWRIHQKGITTIGMLWSMYQLAWRDDEKITWEDYPELAMGTGGIFLLWAPEVLTIAAVSTTPLVILEAAIVTGAVASFAIGGEEGLNTYVDYITDPVDIVQDPEKLEVFMQASEITQAIALPHVWLGGKIIEYGTQELWKYKDEIFRNRWVTF